MSSIKPTPVVVPEFIIEPEPQIHLSNISQRRYSIMDRMGPARCSVCHSVLENSKNDCCTVERILRK
jgi:hypothetical protein